MMRWPAPAGRASRWWLVLDVLYLTALLTFVTLSLRSGLARSWFFSSDEYVIGAEVIRFVQLDFRQRFFDMPGTPFMFLTALVWAGYYWIQTITGGGGSGLTLYTFEHIDALFVLMRVLTLTFFCLSIVLIYALAARLTNRMGAWFAALVLAASPPYLSYSSFVRVESLAMCFMLGSLLTATYWSSHAQRRLLWTAGVLAGLGAACRLHAMMAIVPVLLLFLIGRRQVEPARDYPAWTRGLFAAAATAVAVVGLVLLAGRNSIFARIPKASALLMTVSIVGVVAAALVWAAYRRDTTRRLLLRILPPESAELACAFGAGLLAGTPTILWEPHRLLMSMEMYRSSYIDFTRAAWPLWKNITWYVTFYANVMAPTTILLVLLLAGIVLAVVLRKREILWMAAGLFLFFVSKPLNLRAAEHHIIMWLPYFAIVSAFPAAVVWQFVRPLYTRVAAAAFLTAGLAYLWVELTPSVRGITIEQVRAEKRMTSIREATTWIKQNTDRRSTVLVAYSCFNPDIVYTWFKALAVPVPAAVSDGRTWVIWWGHLRAFQGQSGYALATTSDVTSLKGQIDSIEPGQGTDPYTDPRFRIVQSFVNAPTRVDVFQFSDVDGRAPAK